MLIQGLHQKQSLDVRPLDSKDLLHGTIVASLKAIAKSTQGLSVWAGLPAACRAITTYACQGLIKRTIRTLDMLAA